MHRLTLHPDCPPGAITEITADIVATASGARAVFVARGDVARITVPGLQPPGRFDNLWQTTCFEVFWQGVGGGEGAAYREFNVSPSSRWACYDFDGFRRNSRDGPAEVTIKLSCDTSELRLEADIVSDLPLPARVALNAIIRDGDGANRFWALAFAPGKPEFHSELCRAVTLAARA